MKKGAKRKSGSKAGREVAVVAEESEEDAMGVIVEEPEDSKETSPSRQQEDEGKKKPDRRGGGKRKKMDTEKEDVKKPAPRAKKARATKPQPEYLEEKRNLQDLWKSAFPVGTEWQYIDGVYDINWDFKHLEEALEEGGMLYGKKVYVFGIAEPQRVIYKGAEKFVHVPTVVAVESPFPPSDKIGVTSVQSATEKIIPMKQMKMDWVPYIPIEKRDRQVDRMKSQIFSLVCTQRRSAHKHLKEDRVKKFDYCLPYFFDPLKEDELEQSSEVQLLFPSEPPVVCEFDWENDKLEELVKKLIDWEELSEEQTDEFKEFVNEHVQARAARLKKIEDDREAFESIKFYKFYPQPSPDVSGFLKGPRINRYYGNAHQVL